MIHDDLLRQALLSLTSLVFVAFALWAAAGPDSLARQLGYRLALPNGYSEFYAIYVGVFLVKAALCSVAAWNVQQAVLGDFVAFFLLAQPAGRLLGLIRYGRPRGLLFALFLLEAAAGVALLLLRPSA